MLDSKAYKKYYVVASRAVPPKEKTKYNKKTDEPITYPKSKTASASKGTKLKSKAKVTKPDMKKQHVKKTKAKDERTGTILGVPDVPPYESKNDKESWGDNEDDDGDTDDDSDNDDDAESDDHDDANQTEYKEEDVDEGTRTLFDDELTDEEKLDDEKQ
uniref:Uncharacterized protein n=1 Tax=Tanacetum cinerariifolium TaxID=118510 RepID=A0A6L2NPX1_TANCI|nr:hypothetical protein [Tanacetum cinerariifolium]